jgi:hypothetical protein
MKLTLVNNIGLNVEEGLFLNFVLAISLTQKSKVKFAMT